MSLLLTGKVKMLVDDGPFGEMGFNYFQTITVFGKINSFFITVLMPWAINLRF